MSNRTGVELLPSHCRIVVVGDSAGLLPGQRRLRQPAAQIRAFRSFAFAAGGPATLANELRQTLSSRFVARRAVVVIWGLRGAHQHLLVPPADPADLEALARREAAVVSNTTTPAGPIVADGVMVGGLYEGSSGGRRREVTWVTAQPDDIRSRLQPVLEAGFSVERVITPAVAHAALVRFRPGTNPGVATSVLEVNAHVTGITVVRDGVVLFAREMPWGYDTASADAAGPVRDAAQLAPKLAAELRRSLQFVRQNLRVDATQVLVCGDLPGLRSLTAPLMHDLNMDVETLDSVEGLDVSRLASQADEFREKAGEFRIAWAAAADPAPPVNLMPRESVASKLAVPADLRQRMAAGVLLGILLSVAAFGVIWWLGRSTQSELTELRRAAAALEPQLRALEERQQGAAVTVARRAALDALVTEGPRLARILELVGRSAPGELTVTTLTVEPNGATWSLSIDGEAIAARPGDAQETFGRFLAGLSTSPLLGRPSRPASFRMTSGAPIDTKAPGGLAGAGVELYGVPLGVDLRQAPKPTVTASNTGLEREIADPRGSDLARSGAATGSTSAGYAGTAARETDRYPTSGRTINGWTPSGQGERTPGGRVAAGTAAARGAGASNASGLAHDPNVNGYLWSSRARTVIPLNRPDAGVPAVAAGAGSAALVGPPPSVLTFQFGFEVRK
jgi:Tfp pilus assembly PilM family ATPase